MRRVIDAGCGPAVSVLGHLPSSGLTEQRKGRRPQPQPPHVFQPSTIPTPQFFSGFEKQGELDQLDRNRTMRIRKKATYLTSGVDVDVVLGVLGMGDKGLDQELP